MISIKDALGQALNSVSLGVVAKLAKINADWEQIVGPQLSTVCSPAYIWQKTLIVHVFDPAFMSPLDFSRMQILEKVQNNLGDKEIVQSISVRLGNRDTTTKRAVQPSMHPADTPAIPAIEEALSGAKDPELKGALEKLFRAGMDNGPKAVAFALALLMSVSACATRSKPAPGQALASKQAKAKVVATKPKEETAEEIARRAKTNQASYFRYLKAEMLMQENKLPEALEILKELLKDDPYVIDVYIAISRISLGMGKYSEAIDTALTGLTVDPDSVPLNALLGGVYYSSKNYGRAQGYLKKALELAPGRHDIRLNYALNQLELKKYDEAEKEFLEELRTSPDSVIAVVYLSRVYVEAKNFQKAEEFLTQTVQKFKNMQKAYEALGWVYVVQKKYDLAVDIFKKYLEIEPQDDEMQKRLANVYLLKKSYGEALDLYKELEKQEPDTMDLALKVGILHFQRGEYQQALEKFQLVRLKEPENNSVSFYIARIYEEMGMYREAVQEWEKIALSSPPQDMAEIFVRIAGINEKLGKLDEAENSMDKAIQAKKDDPELHYMQGVIRGKRNKHKDAAESLEKAIKLDPGKPEYYFYLGATYEKTKEYDKSIKAMKRTLELDSKHADALNYIGYLYADQNIKLGEAMDYVQKALALEPDNGFFLDSLAWVYYRQGKLDKALQAILNAISKTKDKDSTLYGHLGDIHAAMKNWDKAFEAYEVSFGLKQDSDIQKKMDGAKKQADRGGLGGANATK